MPKLPLIFLFFSSFCFPQIANNFTVKSCDGQDHELYKALDTGQVVILTWVKPDLVGINFIESAYNVTKEFDASHPKRVSMLVCDDYGDTNCNDMGNWLSGRTFSACLSFSDSSIRMKDYNLNGIPKFAVIANSTHYIFNVQAGTLNDSVFREAINAALIGPVVQENLSGNNFGTTLSPNPCNTGVTIKYRSGFNENLTLELFDGFGKKIRNIAPGKKSSGTNIIQLDTTEFPPGNFFFRISDPKLSDTVKFLVVH